MRIFIGMETSGASRRAFAARGHDVISCDELPAVDGATIGRHIQGEVLETLGTLRAAGWWPDRAIFHPTCTYLTVSAEWAFKDPDFDRYPGVGYHQRLKPGTLFGAARRVARAFAIDQARQLLDLDIEGIALENPVGALSSSIGRPDQTFQPYELGENASKRTCLWLRGKMRRLTIDPAQRFPGRWVRHNGKDVERWGNQTDSGQNRLTPSDERWKDRSETFPLVAAAFAREWG